MKSKFCIAPFNMFFYFSQELPNCKICAIRYGAGNQNWMISQDESYLSLQTMKVLNLTDPVGNCIHRQTRQYCVRKSDW
jgi:hypothetical protein